jgi:hypothetical protein
MRGFSRLTPTAGYNKLCEPDRAPAAFWRPVSGPRATPVPRHGGNVVENGRSTAQGDLAACLGTVRRIDALFEIEINVSGIAAPR